MRRDGVRHVSYAIPGRCRDGDRRFIGIDLASARADASIRLIGPVALASINALASEVASKLERLSAIDSANVAFGHAQTFCLFGGENITNAAGLDYGPKRWAVPAGGAALRDHHIIINESYIRFEHSGFSAEVARRLRPLG